MTFKLEHRIGVAAPARVVWEVIADVAGWRVWNPLHVDAEGVLQIGAPLRLVQQVPDHPSETLTASVVDWVPDAQLVWAVKYAGRLVRGLHFIEIDSLSDEGCILSNGEVFSGLGARFVAVSWRRRMRDALAATGEALKARAEAVYAASQALA